MLLPYIHCSSYLKLEKIHIFYKNLTIYKCALFFNVVNYSDAARISYFKSVISDTYLLKFCYPFFTKLLNSSALSKFLYGSTFVLFQNDFSTLHGTLTSTSFSAMFLAAMDNKQVYPAAIFIDLQIENILIFINSYLIFFTWLDYKIHEHN